MSWRGTFSVSVEGVRGKWPTVNARISAQGSYLISKGEEGVLIQRGALI